MVDLFASALRDINPSLAKGDRLLKPITMSLFGMINWSYLWFRPDGPMSRAEYADLVTQMTVDGISNLGSQAVAPRASIKAPHRIPSPRTSRGER